MPLGFITSTVVDATLAWNIMASEKGGKDVKVSDWFHQILPKKNVSVHTFKYLTTTKLWSHWLYTVPKKRELGQTNINKNLHLVVE